MSTARRFASKPALDWLASVILTFRVAATSLETLVGCALTVVSMYLFDYVDQELPLDMSIFSLAIIFPMTTVISLAFGRRDTALAHLSELLSQTNHLYASTVTWQVKHTSGKWVRVYDLLDHPAADHDVDHVFGQFLASLIDYLTLPRTNRAVHVTGICGGGREHVLLHAVLHEQKLYADSNIKRMGRLVQELKVRGLPGGEVHRLDQYVSIISRLLEKVSALKEYRTPQVFRAFARVWVSLFGVYYGPYHKFLADEDAGISALSLSFAVAMQITLSTIFNLMVALEDPYNGDQPASFDGIKVIALVEVARRQMVRAKQDALRAWSAPVAKEEWGQVRVNECRPTDESCI